MKPEIETYLREYGDKYTREALRAQLIEAGHGPEEVDAALSEWDAAHSRAPESKDLRGRFWRWAWGLHIAAWAVLAIWVFLLAGPNLNQYGGATIGLIVLAFTLLIGLGISGLIGRFMVNSTGLVVALIVPAVSAVLLAGACYAILDGMAV
ncbi:MAG TPA: hypothetical protein VF114_07075 [Candidatus Limnocylindria bacterium]